MRSVIVLFCLVLTTPVLAQDAFQFPAIDDSYPPIYVDAHPGLGYILYTQPFRVEVDYTVRALTRDELEHTMYLATRDLSGQRRLRRGEPSFSVEPETLGPILEHDIEGLVLLGQVLYAVAWDADAGRSSLLEIDSGTGDVLAVHELAAGLRFSGLTHGNVNGLSGVTRDPVSQQSAIYDIDLTTRQLTHVADLPAPCEAVSRDVDYHLVAAGERWFRVSGFAVQEIVLGPPLLGPPPGFITGLARESRYTPVEPVSWGRIKDHFADR